MSKRLRIADWLVHGGHQYEFFKSNHDFFCTNIDGTAPSPKDFGRPRNTNVNHITEERMRTGTYDIIMIRTGIRADRHRWLRYRKGAPPGIAVIQTHTPFVVPKWARCVVWNSKESMSKYRGTKNLRGKKHFYIPHGFDPEEFQFLDLKRNNRILSAVSLFKKRGGLLGFNEWRWVSDKTRRCDLLGHGNDDLKEALGSFQLKELVKKYNEYGVFLNTTRKSAMPRTRAESLMCGTPLVTTNNFGISHYLIHGKNCYFADTKEDMYKYTKKVLSSKNLQKDLSMAGRETAIRYFNIRKYLKRWEQVFCEALR
jgi:glycosyltransferase involved in cell wall biosynthesis